MNYILFMNSKIWEDSALDKPHYGMNRILECYIEYLGTYIPSCIPQFLAQLEEGGLQYKGSTSVFHIYGISYKPINLKDSWFTCLLMDI